MNHIPESHPLQPFLLANAKYLMLGSFPPKKERWSMEFFYPNWINDMWRKGATDWCQGIVKEYSFMWKYHHDRTESHWYYRRYFPMWRTESGREIGNHFWRSQNIILENAVVFKSLSDVVGKQGGVL